MSMIRSTNPVLFEDIFEIQSRDKDGKKFDRVSRFHGHSDLYEMDLILDVNIDVYPLQAGEKISLALAWTLNLDGTPESGKYDASFPTLAGRPTLMDKFEYVMYGKVFKVRDQSAPGGLTKAEVYISYGGLLMQLVGDPKKLEALELDSNVYLLVRKV